MNKRYKWQGEPVEVEFGTFHAKPSTTHPLSWYNFEIETERNTSSDGSLGLPAVRFTYMGEEIIIANHFGIGAHKLRKGGWPDCTHFSFGKGRFIPGEDWFTCKGLREREYAAHEAARESWMKKKDPIAYARIEALRQAAKDIHKKIQA
jgi:hypothetical protein